MKKLMIAAAAAAMVGGAFAADYSGLYNLKFTLKTLAPKQTTCSKTDCTICDPASRSEGNYYENGTVKLEGIIAYCSNCDEITEKSYATAALALWDPTNKEPVFWNDAWKSAEVVYATDAKYLDKSLYYLASGLLRDQEIGSKLVAVSNVFTSIDTTVYGKSSNKVGMDFVMDYSDGNRSITTNDVLVEGVWDLRAAGLGTWCWQKTGEGYVKSVSGNVAGRIPAKTGYTGTKGSGSYWGATVVANECGGAADYCKDEGGNWELPILDDVDWLVKSDPKSNYSVPAYGTWSIKRNDSATNKALYKSLPSYAQNF